MGRCEYKVSGGRYFSPGGGSDLEALRSTGSKACLPLVATTAAAAVIVVVFDDGWVW